MTHSFVVYLQAQELTEELENALFEAGCDDGGPELLDGQVRVSFDREAPTLLDAVVSAVADVRSAGATVERVGDQPVVVVADIAERCGVHRQTVHQWVVGSRGPGGFPAPLRAGGGVRVWRWSAVAAWLEEHGLALGLAEQARTLAQVNAALEVSRAPEPIRALAGVA